MAIRYYFPKYPAIFHCFFLCLKTGKTPLQNMKEAVYNTP